MPKQRCVFLTGEQHAPSEQTPSPRLPIPHGPLPLLYGGAGGGAPSLAVQTGQGVTIGRGVVGLLMPPASSLAGVIGRNVGLFVGILCFVG